MLTNLLVHLLAVAMQLFAIVWALRLIPLTGHARAWLMFTAAFTLMGARRIIEFLGHIGVIQSGVFDLLSDIIVLVTSMLLAAGVYLIRKIFVERVQDRQKLQQQIDELLRFQKLAIGRELRMKELAEENAALRDQLASTKFSEPA